MKSHISLTLVALLGIAVALYAGSSGLADNDPAANEVGTAPRFTIQGEGDSRLMFDSQTGETWVMKTVLQGVTEFDPAPIVVWFPVPRADDSLVNALVARRLDEFTLSNQGQASTFEEFLAEKEQELGTDHPGVVQQREELERGLKVWAEFGKLVQSVFMN